MYKQKLIRVPMKSWEQQSGWDREGSMEWGEVGRMQARSIIHEPPFTAKLPASRSIQCSVEKSHGHAGVSD